MKQAELITDEHDYLLQIASTYCFRNMSSTSILTHTGRTIVCKCICDKLRICCIILNDILNAFGTVFVLLFYILLSHMASILKSSGRWFAGSSIGLYLLSGAVLLGASQAFCPHGCSCNDISVDCTNADGLDVVPILLNPRVISINLSANKIDSIQESLIFYTDLNSLDLSRNKITTLGLRNFEGQKQLRSLILHNNSISSLEEEAFFGLSELQYLSLSNNNLAVVHNGVFKGLDSLQFLHLVSNNIREIENLGFEYLRNIKTINLANNRLKRIPTSSLLHLVSLQELNFCDNQISTVPDRAFQHLSNLSYLNLSKNNISVIHPDSFAGLERLTSLNLLDNRLPTVPTDVFPPLKMLSYLDLSGNLFLSIPRDFLGSLPSLTTLRVERCPRLEAVSQDAFVNGWGLLDLSLSQNPRLRRLPSAALAPLLKLKTLDISSCGLEALLPTQIPMRELRVLDVSGNPLHCNCSLMWLADVAANHTMAPGTPSCAAPPSLYGVPLRDLGAGTCSPAIGPWTIAGCVGVALAGLLTILAFLVCRWKRNNSALPPAASKTLTLCTDSSTDMRRQTDFTSPLNNDMSNMQVYSSPSYYTASAPPVQFIYPAPRQPLHSCPSNCPCIRQSPALRPLLRTPSSTPTQSRILANKSPHRNGPPSHFVEFPPPPTRPPPAVSAPSHTQPPNLHHYKFSPYIPSNIQLHNNLQRANNLQHSGYSGPPPHVGPQLLSTDWLYSGGSGPEDPQHHWYASIDRSSSSCTAAGNESSGYWEEDKEQPTASLLPSVPKQQPSPQDAPPIESEQKTGATSSPVVQNAIPTSYI